MLIQAACSCWLLASAGCLALHFFSRQLPRVPFRALELLRLLVLLPLFGAHAAPYMLLLLPLWLLGKDTRNRLGLEFLGLPVLLLPLGQEHVCALTLAMVSGLQLMWLVDRLDQPPLGWRAPFESRPAVRALARMLTGCLVLGAPLWWFAQVLAPWQWAALTFLTGLAASPWRPRATEAEPPARRPSFRRELAATAVLAGLGTGWLAAAPSVDPPLSQVLRALGATVARDVVIVPEGVECAEILQLSRTPLRVFNGPARAANPWPGLLLLGLAALALRGGGRARSPVLAPVEAVSVELGAELTHSLPGPLHEEVLEVRRWVALEVGLMLPAVSCRFNSGLPHSGYRILLRGEVAAAGEVYSDEQLAVTPITGRALEELEGKAAFQLPVPSRCGIWTRKLAKAREMGARLLRPEQLIAAHLKEVVRLRAHHLLGLEQVEELLERHRVVHPTLVARVRESLPLVELTGLLRELLHRGSSLRDLNGVLQAVVNRSPRPLVERVAAGCGAIPRR